MSVRPTALDPAPLWRNRKQTHRNRILPTKRLQPDQDSNPPSRDVFQTSRGSNAKQEERRGAGQWVKQADGLKRGYRPDRAALDSGLDARDVGGSDRQMV